MSFNLLAISVGNTRTRLGQFLGGKFNEDATPENAPFSKLTDAIAQAWAPLADKDDAIVMLASVNPPVAERVEAFAKETLKAYKVLRVERDINIPIGRQLDPEALVGEDRLLNAAAAFDVLKQAVVIVDCGTAITVDFVDGAGTFHGGAIAPGATMMLKALREHTAQLPEVTPARPAEVIGHNTIEAMRSGMYHGLRGMVKELTEQYAEVAGTYPMIVVTGGDAPLLFEGDELIDRIVPQLTIIGMAATLRRAIEAETE